MRNLIGGAQKGSWWWQQDWVEFTETGLQKVLEWRGWWTTLVVPSSGTGVAADAGEVSS